MNLFRKKIVEIFSLDVRSLAIFRIFLGINLLVDLAVRAQSLQAFYTDAGILPRYLFITQAKTPWIWSFHLMGGTAFSQAALLTLQAVFAFGLLVGYRTRLMTFLSWILLLSLHNRFSHIQNSGDLYFRLSLLWSVFIPLGACWSVDRQLNSSKEKIPTQIFNAGTMALALQMVIVYVMAALPKLQSADWHGTGSAVYYTLNMDIFATRAAHALLLFPHFLTFLTYTVMFYEFLAPFLILSPVLTGPVRTFSLLAFLLMHAAFGLCLKVDPFPRISVIELLPFFPTWLWKRIDPYLIRVKTLWKTSSEAVLRVRGIHKLMHHLARRPLRIRPYRWEAFVVAFLFGLGAYSVIGASNIFRGSLPAVPPFLTVVRQAVGLDQAWSMFAPGVSRSSGWIVVPGKLKNGREVDLYRNGAPVSWAAPDLVSSSFETERWRRLFAVMLGGNRDAFHAYSQYLCMSWNRSHGGDEQLQSLKVIVMSKTALENYRIQLPQPVTYWRMNCVALPKEVSPARPPQPHSWSGPAPQLVMESPYAP